MGEWCKEAVVVVSEGKAVGVYRRMPQVFLRLNLCQVPVLAFTAHTAFM